MSNLAPITSQFVSSSPTTLILKEKSALSLNPRNGDSATILDTNGNVVFEIEAHLISLSQNRTIKTSTGAKIGTIRKKRLPAITMTGIKQAWYLGSLEDERKCRVQMKGVFNPTSCNAEIYLGDTVIGEVVGNWSARSYTISIDNKQVAEVKRHTGITGHIQSKDEYCIEIAAGVDTAFISMVVIALDEMYHDDGNKRGW